MQGQLRAQSISLQVSDRERCSGSCKFCISRTTPGTSDNGVACAMLGEARLRVGLRVAERMGATHAILTGRADPTQEDPKYISWLISECTKYLPLCDMHTNGVMLLQGMKRHNSIGYWVNSGLTMMTISIAHHDDQKNQELMGISHDTKPLITDVRREGLLARCSVILAKSGVSSVEDLIDYIHVVGGFGAQMVVVRELWVSENYTDANTEVLDWNKENKIDLGTIEFDFRAHSEVKQRDRLPWGQNVYVIDGQWAVDKSHGINVTFARCNENNPPILKSIVHRVNGHGYRNWDSNGDILY